MGDPKGQLLTTLEAAKLLRMSSRTLENMRVDGTGGPHYVKLGPGRQRVVYRLADLDEWVAKYVRGSMSAEEKPDEE